MPTTTSCEQSGEGLPLAAINTPPRAKKTALARLANNPVMFIVMASSALTVIEMRFSMAWLLGTALLTASLHTQAAPARYYKWQGADRVVCAQTSPGWGWKRLSGFYVKSDCSI